MVRVEVPGQLHRVFTREVEALLLYGDPGRCKQAVATHLGRERLERIVGLGELLLVGTEFVGPFRSVVRLEDAHVCDHVQYGDLAGRIHEFHLSRTAAGQRDRHLLLFGASLVGLSLLVVVGGDEPVDSTSPHSSEQRQNTGRQHEPFEGRAVIRRLTTQGRRRIDEIGVAVVDLAHDSSFVVGPADASSVWIRIRGVPERRAAR